MKYTSNYHTHCYLCKHAKGSIEDYVKKAILHQLKNIGISDHAPFDFINDQSVRMRDHQYPIYLKELEAARKKYASDIKVLKSLEIEYFSHKLNHYKTIIQDLDYLILGQHYIEMNGELKSVYHLHTLEELSIYKNTIIEAMSTGLFKIVAHPDIFLFNQGALSEEVKALCLEIITAAKTYNVLLEVNANGLRRKKHEVNGRLYNRYPREDFWKLVSEEKAKAIIGADAHKPSQLYDQGILDALKFSTDLSIEVEEELVL